VSSRVFMTVENRKKDIPYPAETRRDGQNFGFKSLKGKSGKTEGIQEAKGFPGIISVLLAINDVGSPFFSIGCEKYIGPEKFGGFYARGYIEFAFNYRKMVSFQQAADLFHDFSVFCSQKEIPEGTNYNFDLQPAYFTRAKVDGYSCCVWTKTVGHANHAEAERAYNDAVQFLGEFITRIGPPSNEPERIY
jgi:hypothetical protein